MIKWPAKVGTQIECANSPITSTKLGPVTAPKVVEPTAMLTAVARCLAVDTVCLYLKMPELDFPHLKHPDQQLDSFLNLPPKTSYLPVPLIPPCCVTASLVI